MLLNLDKYSYMIYSFHIYIYINIHLWSIYSYSYTQILGHFQTEGSLEDIVKYILIMKTFSDNRAQQNERFIISMFC